MDKKIVIIGNYGAKNTGDEAILSGTLKMLEKLTRREHITVLSYDPRDTAQRHGIRTEYLFPFGIRSFFKFRFFHTARALRQADMVLIGGGSLFTDEKMKAMWLWYYHVWLSSRWCRKVVLFANGIGPLRTEKGKQIMKKVLAICQLVTVRDRESLNLLRTLSKKQEIYETGDPTFLLNKIFDQKRRKQVVVSLRPWLYDLQEQINNLALFTDKLIEQGYKIVLLPFQTFQDDDRKVLQQLYAKILNKKNVQYIHKDLSLEEVQKIIGESEAVIGMRLHSLILAIIEQTPFIGLGYSKKVQTLAEESDRGEWYLDLKDITLINLESKWRSQQQQVDAIRQHLAEKHEAFGKKSLESLTYLEQLLSD